MRLVEERCGKAPPSGEFANERELLVWAWELLRVETPEIFRGIRPPIGRMSGLGYALLHAQSQDDLHLSRLRLSAREAQSLRLARRLIRNWSGLPRWRGFEHLVFDQRSVLVEEAFRACLGPETVACAFTFHPLLGRTALYRQSAIEDFRRRNPLYLPAALIHEETHLALSYPHGHTATVAADPGTLFEEVAHLNQWVSYLLMRDRAIPTKEALLRFLNGYRPAGLIETRTEPTVPELIAAVASDAQSEIVSLSN